ncbi:hypothetical protein LB543_01445 [Mesorhizobium sp. ESP7-2]|uniref:hypothetical protein n=1 Tax=Mesorhizobium sp. ESP7-2 TaxID=2876622 RepID=UPI001CCDC9D6|nr:hypothetical protein [Mesorhizobium sp. ESP7-2]MBZ9705393.1 hypothetical protein [Mesorhizobium sp. ESP7-2]
MLTYVGNGAWGSGKGAPLDVSEFDGNIWELVQRIAAIIADIPAPLNISNITVIGTQMTIYLENATVFGPFTLPQADFRPNRGGALDAPTDGVYVVSNTDFNRYWRYAGSGDLTIELPVTASADMEVTFRQGGAGALIFADSTDVTVNGLEGFLNRTGGPGSVITAKFAATGEWDLIGRLAEDVTA